MRALPVPPITAPTGPRRSNPTVPPRNPDDTVLRFLSSFNNLRYSLPVSATPLAGKLVVVVVAVAVLPYVAGFDGREYADDDDVGAAPVGGGEFRACENGGTAAFGCS